MAEGEAHSLGLLDLPPNVSRAVVNLLVGQRAADATHGMDIDLRDPPRVEISDAAALVALMGTCTLFRDLVLRCVGRVVLRVSLPTTDQQSTKAAAVLRLAPRVHLRAQQQQQQQRKKKKQQQQHQQQQQVLPGQQQQEEQLLEQWLQQMTAVLGGPLSSITRIELEGLKMPAIVPAYLAHTCPNLRALAHGSCSFHNSGSASECSTLEQLSIETVSGQQAEGPGAAAALQQCLSRLPKLRDLRLHDRQQLFGVNPIQSLLPISKQLVQLDYKRSNQHDEVKQLAPAELALLAQFSRLQELHATLVDDRCMEVLLALPQLQHVVVSEVDLQSSFRHMACRWHRLTCAATLRGLAHLPQGIQQLELRCIKIWGEQTATMAAAAVEVVRQLPAYGTDSFSVITMSGTSSSVLAAALALLSTPPLQHVTRVRLLNFSPVTGEIVAALGKHLPVTCKQVEFIGSTWFDEDAQRQLFPNKPARSQYDQLMSCTSQPIIIKARKFCRWA